jgi:hypothetical protein
MGIGLEAAMLTTGGIIILLASSALPVVADKAQADPEVLHKRSSLPAVWDVKFTNPEAAGDTVT